MSAVVPLTVLACVAELEAELEARKGTPVQKCYASQVLYSIQLLLHCCLHREPNSVNYRSFQFQTSQILSSLPQGPRSALLLRWRQQWRVQCTIRFAKFRISPARKPTVVISSCCHIVFFNKKCLSCHIICGYLVGNGCLIEYEDPSRLIIYEIGLETASPTVLNLLARKVKRLTLKVHL